MAVYDRAVFPAIVTFVEYSRKVDEAKGRLWLGGFLYFETSAQRSKDV